MSRIRRAWHSASIDYVGFRVVIGKRTVTVTVS
jgi:hypothetical protein